MANRKTLTPRQMKFVAAYISGKGGAESAREAGYSPANARGRAYELLNENKTVMAAIAEAQEQVRKEANYNSERALEELKDQIAKATDAKQYSAVARLVELKLKLSGLLDAKDKGGPTAAVQINIAGIDSPEPGATSIYD
jgi:phage terminase small subunit